MAKTGYLIVVYQDVNPSSPTYNQTREERTQDEENCPSSAAAHWIEDTRYCELTEGGMNTGYEITVYRDVEPLSATYNQTREERELNLIECEADETAPNWRNIGEPFCRQMVYMPGGLLGNDGYMVQQQQDMNEYSPTADEIRDVETLDLVNCPIPDTQPVWQNISESCHLVMYGGQLVYDGTKDVTRVNTNRYSPSWNSNIPETVNIEDETNCPSAIEVQYRWVVVTGEYICVGYDKHSMEKKQLSRDGGTTWTDVTPLETRAGALIEANSEDCGYEPTVEYRWVVVTGQYVCVGFDKHTMEKKQQSVDGGEWTDVTPLETRAGELIEANSEDCGYEPTYEYRWVVITGQYECVGYDKYAVEKKQQSTDGGQNWTDVEPLQTRTGSLIEHNSEDCGYIEPQYRWVVVSDTFVCVGYDKHEQEKQQVSYDNGQTWEDVVPANTRTGSLIEANSEDCGYTPPTPTDYDRQYLTFESLEDDNRIVLSTGYYTSTLTVYISLDNGLTWTEKQARNRYALATLNRGEKMLIKGNNAAYASSNSNYSHFQVHKPYKVSGNIMSLVYGDNFIGQTQLTTSYTFAYLFSGLMTYEDELGTLISAENLILPGTSSYSYYCLFYGERHLTTAPSILPATTLANGCYRGMFSGCRSLTSAPALPATTLAYDCYDTMFEFCSSLTSAPALPATTLAEHCYNSMFQGCTALTAAPELPATTLVSNCYNNMFYGCTNLNYIKAMFTTKPSNSYTTGWVYGVAASGTFVKNSSATWDVTGNNGIPSGWTVISQ